jgi:Pyruvate/2-oxoacid:ferredoxin oxidoreductase gamma subunit
MDEPTKPSPESRAADSRAAESRAADARTAESRAAEERSNSLGVGVVFAVLGFTLFMTVDNPWAGVPMVVLGAWFAITGLRRARRSPE